MKRLSFIIAAATALTLSGCAVEEMVGESPDKVMAAKTLTLSFTTRDADTKTSFISYNETSGSYPVQWTAEDHNIGMSLNFDGLVHADVLKETPESRHADFTATFTDSGSPYRFYGFSPLSAAKAVSESRTSWTVTIPAVQTPKADGLSCDESAMLLYAQTDQMDALPTDPIQLKFKHATTYCRLTLKNLATALGNFDAADATIRSVDMVFSVPVVGEWYVDTADGSLEPRASSHTITLLPGVKTVGEQLELWAAMAPCTLDGAKVSVTVVTDKGRLSRDFTYGTRTYLAGAVNKLSLDMTKGSSFLKTSGVAYTLVTSINDINAGDEVIITDAADPRYAMTGTNNAANGIKAIQKTETTGFSYDSATSSVSLPEGSQVAVWTVNSKNGSTLTFKYSDRYLGSATSGNTHYPTIGSSAKSFSFSSVTGGESRLSYKSGSGKTTYYLWYSTDNFKLSASTSTSTAKNLAIFKRGEIAADPDNDPILNRSDFGAYLTSETSDHSLTGAQLSREYKGLSTTFAILFPIDNAALEISGIPAGAAKGNSFSISVVRIIGKNKENLGTFNVTVVREEGAKLWLSDFKGNGFIVKR